MLNAAAASVRTLVHMAFCPGGKKFMNRKFSGMLFIAAGVAFFVAAWLGQQRAFLGVGIAFIGIGIAFLIRRERNTEGKE
jgi:hypothetical protein